MAIRKAIMTSQPLCPICLSQGRTVASEQVDHIIPLHKGGTDAGDNLQALCKPCHEVKTLSDVGAVKPVIGLDGWPL
jgi:5-methylcytosine-specific restriction protein A